MDDTSKWICKRVVLKSAKAAEAKKQADAASPAGAQGAAADAAVAGPESRAPGLGQTFIYRGADFEGTLRLRQSIQIDCEFRGEILSEGRVVVAETASIQANVYAHEVVIAGVVVGNVKARRQAIIRAGGRVHGDIEAPCLEVEKGASFNGRMSMVSPTASLRAAPGASDHPEPGDDSSSPSPAASATPSPASAVQS